MIFFLNNFLTCIYLTGGRGQSKKNKAAEHDTPTQEQESKAGNELFNYYFILLQIFKY